MHHRGPGLIDCPFCQGPAECDEVDVGVGFVQCGPYVCQICGANQMGPELSEHLFGGPPPEGVTEEELKVGWYRTLHRVSPHANTFQGELVSHEVATRLYRMGLLDEKPTK